MKNLKEEMIGIKKDYNSLMNDYIKVLFDADEDQSISDIFAELDSEQFMLIKDALALLDRTMTFYVEVSNRIDRIEDLDTKLDGLMDKLNKIEKKLDK